MPDLHLGQSDSGFNVGHGLIAAVAWCRLGSSRTPKPWPEDADFREAERLGFLRHHPTWHATPQGEGVLIAAGLLEGAPAGDLSTIHVLWARSNRYPTPQFVAAFGDGLVEAWWEEYDARRRQAEEEYSAFTDDDWTFWTTVEHVPQPAKEATVNA